MPKSRRNWIKSLRQSKMRREAYSYSCLMAKIPESLAKKVRDFGKAIPEERILKDDKGERGRQKEVHVTVKYGIHTQDPAEVFNVIQNFGSLKAKLGKTTVFWNEESIVIKVSVESYDLVRMNNMIRRQLECTDTYPDYKPHVTIAYVKKDEKDPYWFQQYLNNDFEGIEVELDELEFSTPDGQKYRILLKEDKMEDKISKVAKGGYYAELAKAIEDANQQIHGWKATFEHPGFLDWTRPGSNVSVQASPFWDSDKNISVQVTDNEGDVLGAFDVPMEMTGNLKIDVDIYLQKMNSVWGKVMRLVEGSSRVSHIAKSVVGGDEWADSKTEQFVGELAGVMRRDRNVKIIRVRKNMIWFAYRIALAQIPLVMRVMEFGYLGSEENEELSIENDEAATYESLNGTITSEENSSFMIPGGFTRNRDPNELWKEAKKNLIEIFQMALNRQ